MPLVDGDTKLSQEIDRTRGREEGAGSRWFTVAARVVMVAAALVVLASIGRFAARRAAAVASSASVDAGDLRAALPATERAAVDAAVPASAPAPASTAGAVAGPASTGDPVYVNYASAEELRRLPGIGAKRAEAIVALRGRMGRFQRVEDLLRVKGIGRATIKKLRPLVRLDPPPRGDAGGP
ncbi:MAG: ComEA family DNA-binding protein [Labilithrix sp.]